MATEAKKAGRKPKAAKDPNAPAETKAEKFKRLGTARLNKALAQLTGLQKLCTPAYEWTPEQAEKIVVALKGAVNGVEKSLAREKTIKAQVEL